MQMEYVTDPVVWPKLRCEHCGHRLRQMREDLTPAQSLGVFLCGEPLAWLVVSLGAIVGLVADAVVVLCVAWAIIVPSGVSWLYMLRLRRASFLCSSCGHICGYAAARSAGGGARRRPKP
ncbi:hypothetical protein ASE39_00160 [Acidovorax sp. Root267]|nr:hypothetical protein ASE39_00160 [Acidovorax sp. Root267]